MQAEKAEEWFVKQKEKLNGMVREHVDRLPRDVAQVRGFLLYVHTYIYLHTYIHTHIYTHIYIHEICVQRGREREKRKRDRESE